LRDTAFVSLITERVSMSKYRQHYTPERVESKRRAAVDFLLTLVAAAVIGIILAWRG
jgi:hypothetical protein